MKSALYICILFLSLLCLAIIGHAQPVIYANQVAFDAASPKIAVLQTDGILEGKTAFTLIDVSLNKKVFSGTLGQQMKLDEWLPGKLFYRLDFTLFHQTGKFKICIAINGTNYYSYPFDIAENAIAKFTIPSIIHYYNKQRANTPQEMAADKKLQLFGSNKTVDLHGGWCDASGDVSKYFSHLAYANFMSPQQIPLVTWSMETALEAVPKLLTFLGVKDSLENEAIYGADYIMRSLSPDNYFYMTVFSYFNPKPEVRRIVGLLANSVTTADYQCAFREGGGMAIAALARISRWNKHGDFTSPQYLDAAKRAFAHLLINNLKYDDDGKENIIDDYCALMAASELWMATNENMYQNEARKRADNLAKRMSQQGYFMANDAGRAFWHASDAGLPTIALVRYLKKETDEKLRTKTLGIIKKALDYNLSVTNNVSNPFGYARQSFSYQQKIKDGFFIPHNNETGWWWQGEDARLASLATAAIVGGKLVYPQKNRFGVKDSLAAFATQQLSWILGCNPFSMCFMYGFGQKNVPHMASQFGHGSEKGGISNGITGKDGNGDGSGIDFKTKAEGNEWRWTEQWIPHAAWFLQAVSAMSEE